MKRIDVICEPENLPRIRLLVNHMQTLQIELVLHDETPPDHSNRLIYVPKSKDSRFTKTPKGPNFERIALYLDAGCEPIDAEMAVELVTWPGRSSDEAVARLASYLHRPFNPTTQPNQDTSTSAPHHQPIHHQSIRTAKDAMVRVKQKLTATGRNRVERRNMLILAATAAAVVSLFSWLDLDSSQEIKEQPVHSEHAPQKLDLLEDKTTETASSNDLLADVGDSRGRSDQTTAAAPSSTSVNVKDHPQRKSDHSPGSSDVAAPARHAPTTIASNGKDETSILKASLVAQRASHSSDHSYLICATQEDRLQGVMLTSPFFHNEPCSP